jgi:hypothetical protein
MFLCLFSVTVCAQNSGFVQQDEQFLPEKTKVNFLRGKVGSRNILTEEDFRVWNEFKSEKQGFRILFPTKLNGLKEEQKGKFTILETETETARYGLMRMGLPTFLNKDELENLYESIVPTSSENDHTKLISKRDVQLRGRFGKEIVYEEDDNIVFARFYIIDHHFYVLRVSLSKEDYTKGFDQWALKFLDSFGAQTDGKLVT